MMLIIVIIDINERSIITTAVAGITITLKLEVEDMMLIKAMLDQMNLYYLCYWKNQ
jgi:hypothetical protein